MLNRSLYKHRLLLTALSVCCAMASGIVFSENAAPGKPVPINAGGVAVVDIPDSSAQTVQLSIDKGRFAEQSVGHLLLTAKNIDFRQGSLDGLTAEIREGMFETVPVDEFKLVTNGFSFNTVELLSNRRFVLDKPVNANVSLKISEKSLNAFFSNPKTMEKLESAIARKTGNVKLIGFSNPSVNLEGNNRIHLNLTMTLTGNSTGTPMDFVGNLVLRERKLAVTNLTASTNDVQLPVDVAAVLEKKFNDMIDLQKLGKKSIVIQADKLKVTGKAVEINGQAALTRLEFGNGAVKG